MLGKPPILSLFLNSLNKLNKTWALMSDPQYGKFCVDRKKHTNKCHIARKPVFGVSDEEDSSQYAQLRRLARILTFYFQQVKVLYFPINVYNNGSDQTAWMRRLVCAFVVHVQQSGFLILESHHKICQEMLTLIQR